MYSTFRSVFSLIMDFFNSPYKGIRWEGSEGILIFMIGQVVFIVAALNSHCGYFILDKRNEQLLVLLDLQMFKCGIFDKCTLLF